MHYEIGFPSPEQIGQLTAIDAIYKKLAYPPHTRHVLTNGGKPTHDTRCFYHTGTVINKEPTLKEIYFDYHPGAILTTGIENLTERELALHFILGKSHFGHAAHDAFHAFQPGTQIEFGVTTPEILTVQPDVLIPPPLVMVVDGPTTQRLAVFQSSTKNVTVLSMDFDKGVFLASNIDKGVQIFDRFEIPLK